MARDDEKRRNEILKALEYADKIRSLGLECMVRDENGRVLDAPSAKIELAIINNAIKTNECVKSEIAELRAEFFGSEGMQSVQSALQRDGILIRMDGMIVIDPALLGAILRKLVR